MPEQPTSAIEENHPFYRLLATKYKKEREDEAIEILNANPELATMLWPGPDDQSKPLLKTARRFTMPPMMGSFV